MYKRIFLTGISFLLLFLVGFTSGFNETKREVSIRNVLDKTPPDSFQRLIYMYEKNAKSFDSLQKIISENTVIINENTNAIPDRQQELDDIKLDIQRIYAKQDQKKKAVLSKQDARNMAINDSLKRLFESQIADMRKQIEVAQKNIKASRMELENKNAYSTVLLNKIRYIASTINGSYEVTYRNISHYIYMVNMESEELRLHLYNPKDRNSNFYSLGAVKKYLEAEKLKPLMITNAGMFNYSYEPVGLYIESNSKNHFPLDTNPARKNANFYLKPNGVFYIDGANIPHIDTTEKFLHLSDSYKGQIKIATQSGPMLVIDGSIHRAFIPDSKNSKIRSGVGLIKGNTKKVLFAITLDGNNFNNFAMLFRDIFNCDNALFLDGAISQMYLHDLAPDELGGDFGPMISVTKKSK